MTPQTHEFPFLSAALAHAERGWRVFPLAPGSKVPCQGSHGHLDATTNAETLRAWWDSNPRLNVAIATGAASNLVVLDVDLRHGGDASLYELEARWGVLPDTVRVETAGGWHLYFVHPGRALRPNLGYDHPGLDLKADGGYIVAPPSIHPDGPEYRFSLGPEDVPLADLPEAWVEALAASPPSPLSVGEGRGGEGSPIPRGTRHTTLVRLAGRLVNAGLSSIEQVRAALHAANLERCDPPLAASEVERIAQASGAWRVRRLPPGPLPQKGEPSPPT